MDVRIYQRSKSPTQSGRARVGKWVIEPELPTDRFPEPLMGWTSSGDTFNQLILTFSTQNDAEQFAKHNGWRYTISDPHVRKIVPRNYADNFVYRAEGE